MCDTVITIKKSKICGIGFETGSKVEAGKVVRRLLMKGGGMVNILLVKARKAVTLIIVIIV